MTQTAQPLLGRCRDCDYALFATDEDVKLADDLRGVQAGTGAYRVGNEGHLARCPSGHRVFPLKRVKGTYSPDHKCDSRCLNAKGHECTCSCGGANHGKGHVAVVVAASDAREPQHIGEVDKFIKGTAKVSDKKLNIGQYANTLLVFQTAKGDIIKWFAPANLGAPYEVGQEVTFRAKVKKHEDHERFGKSTIVTYFEEVEA